MISMKRFTGISQRTATKIVLDVAAVFVAFDTNASYEANKASGKCVGATQGGCSFTVTPNFRHIKVDGLPENVVGFDELVAWTANINAKMLEQDAKNLKNAIGAAQQEEVLLNNVKYHRIAPKEFLDDSDYLDNVTLAGRIRGSSFPVYAVVHKALNTGGLNWNFGDQAETVSDVSFNGNYEILDNDTLSMAPFELFIPAEISEAAAAAAIRNGGEQ